MVRAALVAGLVCAALVPDPVFSQSDDPASGAAADSDIVVTGELPRHRDVIRQARTISATSNIRYYPLPLFADRLCPGVYGMKADYAAMIVDRIRHNAERFDLWMAEDDGTCEPNLIVAFVDDGQALLQQIADERRLLFGDMPRPERLELLAGDGPVRVWTSTVPRAGDGMPVGEDPLDGTPIVRTSAPASRFFLPVGQAITWVLVLFDRDDVRDKTLLQLADYATMRGLTRTRPVDADGVPLDTILALFDTSAEPPAQLTAFDGAYLGAVYRGRPNLTGLTKVLGIQAEMRRQAAAQAATAVGGEARSEE